MKLKSSAFARVVDTPSVMEILHQGLAHHQNGQVEQAIEFYRRALLIQPNEPDAMHLCGVALLQLGLIPEAEKLLERAVTARPTDPSFWLNLGNARLERNNAPGAVTAYDRAIALQPNNADFHYNRANVFAALGQHEPAIDGYVAALQHNPDHAGAHFNLANSLLAEERDAEAIPHYEFVIQNAPTTPNLWTNVGICLANLRQYEEAESALRLALRNGAQDAQAHGNLGALLAKRERWDEAVAELTAATNLDPRDITHRFNLARTLQKARRTSAIQVAEAAAHLAPHLAEAWIVLGDARLAFGMTDPVLDAYQKALAIDPNCLRDTNNLGLAYYRAGYLDEAIAFYEEALTRRPEDSEAWADMGVARLHRGDVAISIENLEESIRLKPSSENAHSTLLISECYSHRHSGEDLRQEAERWASIHTPTGHELPPIQPVEKKKLRIGYLSADFHVHPAGNLYAALFPHHDPERFDVVAYSTNPFQDEVTKRIMNATSKFEVVCDLSPDELAARIREDEVDILIDLLGHTPGHRLKAFARRPAPVQATWLGYFGTTGMAQMDYILADQFVLPEAHEHHFTERPARLPNCMYAYQPPALDIHPGSLPLHGNGFVTFGCFNNLSKIHEDVVALWCEVLNSIPGSRMVLNRWPLRSAAVRENYWAWFEKHGVSRDRVDLNYTKGREAYFESYQAVDIMLDSFPFGGGTTTSDALWMGVPVISLSSDRFVGRMTETILHTVGVAELLPTSREEFVQMSVDLAADTQRLGEYRSSLRERLTSSPMCDIRQFTRDLESTYEWMWQQAIAAA